MDIEKRMYNINHFKSANFNDKMNLSIKYVCGFDIHIMIELSKNRN